MRRVRTYGARGQRALVRRIVALQRLACFLLVGVFVSALAGALVSGCGVAECAGGTQVRVVNQSASTLRVDITPSLGADGGMLTRSIAPGESLLLIDQEGVGLSALPPEQTISHVRVYSGREVFYDGPIEAPGFALEAHGQSGEVCSSERYTLEVTSSGPPCGFVPEGDCPPECWAFSGHRLMGEPTACLPFDRESHAWCGDPARPALGATVCRVLPSGEQLLLNSIPGDLPGGDTCAHEFCRR